MSPARTVRQTYLRVDEWFIEVTVVDLDDVFEPTSEFQMPDYEMKSINIDQIKEEKE